MSLEQKRLIKKEIIYLFLFFSVFLLINSELNLFTLDNSYSKDFKENGFKQDYIRKLHTAAESYSGIGNSLNVTESGNGNFQHNNLNLTNNENASIIVPNDWKADEITGNIFNLRVYDKYWVNETFDTGFDSNFWSSHTDRPQNVSFGWYDAPTGKNDSIFIEFEEANNIWNNVDSHWNYTFLVPQEHLPFVDWEVEFNYRVLTNNLNWLDSKIDHYFELQVNEQVALFKQSKLDTVSNNTWYTDNLDPITPEVYNFNLPGTIILRFGIDFKNSGINPTGFFKIFYDNVTLKLSTIPKPSQINLSIDDLTNGDTTSIFDAMEYGEGEFNLLNNWEGEIGGKYHYFSYSHNSSGNVFVSSDFDVKASSEKKTTLELGSDGCQYIVENDSKVVWTTYFTINPPGTYSNDYFLNITKPLNWVIKEAVDPYLNNRINDVIGTGYGNTSFIIPNSIITNGIWKFVAEAPNYVLDANLYNLIGIDWKENNSFQVPERIKVNATVESLDNPDIDISNATLVIYLPNGTLWYQEKSDVDLSGFVEFTPITLGGENTTIGQYTIQVLWNNYDVNMSQVGLKTLHFEITKDSLLQRSNFHDSKRMEVFAGDNLLIKVNFTDFFTGEGLADAMVNYTMDNTTKITGIMIYQGGGIYIADIETGGLQIGLYNISVSAVKPFYSPQNNIELFEIEIQRYTSLLRSEAPTKVQMNDNATVKYVYKDSFDVGISGASIIFNINVAYIIEIIDDGDGNYSITFNTAGFNSLGTQQFIANFSKSYYQTQLNFMQFDIVEQNVNITTLFNSEILNENTIKDVRFKEQLNLSVRVFAVIDKNYLKGGILTWISDKFEHNFTEGPDTYYNLSLILDGEDFNSGLNTIFLRFELQNYTTETFTFQLYIRAQNIILDVKIDSFDIIENDLIEDKSFNDLLDISCRGFAETEATYLSGASVTLVVDSFEFNLSETINFWYNKSIQLQSDVFNLGINYVYVKFELANYTTTTFSFQLQVNQIEISVETIDFSNSISVVSGDRLTLWINLTEPNSDIPIINATVYCYWEFGTYYFEYMGDGLYRLNLGPQTAIGPHNFNLVITPKKNIYSTTQFSFLIIITERYTPNYLFLIIVISLIVIIAALGILSIRSYVILPMKRKKQVLINEKTQPYKDIRNIEAIIISSKQSGMTLYNKTFSILDEDYITGFSGFIQAITILGKQYTKEGVKISSEEEFEDLEFDIKELDFNFFHSLICDYESVRVILLLREKSSKQLRIKIGQLTQELYSEHEDLIIGFMGNLKALVKPFEDIIYRYFPFYYKGPFTLNKNERYQSLKLSGDLSKLELRILNALESQSKYNKQFYLKDISSRLFQNVEEDKFIITIESLISKQLITPVSQKYSLFLS